MKLLRSQYESANGVLSLEAPISEDPDTVDSDICRAFTRFDIHASAYEGGPPPLRQHHRFTHTPIFQDKIRDFSSIYEAQTALDKELICCYQFVRQSGDIYRYWTEEEVPLEVFARQVQLLDRLATWRTIFEDFLNTQSNVLTTKDLKTALLLKISHTTMHIMLTNCLVTEEVAYDSFIDHFRKIVNWAKTLHPTNAVDTEHESPIKPHYSVEMGIIQPLGFTAVRCRDPLIRREALTLLSTSSWIEGAWDSKSSANVCEHIIKVEEEGLGEIRSSSDIFEHRRVHGIQLQLDVTTRSAVIDYSVRSNGIDGGYVDRVDHLQWKAHTWLYSHCTMFRQSQTWISFP